MVRTDRIGDVVLSLPVISALRRKFPESRLAMLVRPENHPVVEDYPGLDEVLFDGAGARGLPGFFRIVRCVRKKRFDAVLILHPTFRLALICFMAGVPIRIGTGYRIYSVLFNRRVYEHRRHSTRHEAEYNLSLVSHLGADSHHVTFELAVRDEEKASLFEILVKNRIPSRRPLIILHPGSRGSALDWPPVYFGNLADELIGKLDAQVIITGIEEEKPVIDEVCSHARGRIHNLAGELTLKQLMALLQSADLVIANSTGPLHLAAALGTAVVGLYPPFRTAGIRRWGPYGRKNSVLVPPYGPCAKCRKERCPHWNCMNTISVSAVFEKAWDQLHIQDHS